MLPGIVRLRLLLRHLSGKNHIWGIFFSFLFAFIYLASLASRSSTDRSSSVSPRLSPRVLPYQASFDSVAKHTIPEWFDDAKLGIFIHWGLFSVPAFATTGLDFGEIGGADEAEKWRNWFKHNAYAEWYFNTIRIDGSPAQEHHRKVYGMDFAYEDFVPLFQKAVESWNPEKMASLFQDVHAQYVVLVTKHHDGFLMWPSQTPNKVKKNYHSKRNIVRELGKAVKERGMRMGHYYSGAVDWSYKPDPLVLNQKDLRAQCQQNTSYIEYATAHWQELIDTYKTDILWNDIGYPPGPNLNELFAHYYNVKPDGVINDRFQQMDSKGNVITANHFDITTPEYKLLEDISTAKWESCRGIGHSFGYNQMEGPTQYLTVKDLVHSFVDIVSKNGNLLLNVGPKADGSLPEIQEKRLRALGEWLDRNGQAIFKSRPWIRAQGKTDKGIDVRFTQREGRMFAIVLGAIESGTVTILTVKLEKDATVYLLGREKLKLDWEQSEIGFSFHLPDASSLDTPAYSVEISKLPI